VYSQKEEYKEYISQTSLFLRRINIVYKDKTMTEQQKEYFENKYKTFIRVWQTSDSINEVRMRLSEQHNWFINMDRTGGRYSPLQPLTLTAVRSYYRRITKKGVLLKELPLGVESKPFIHSYVDYKKLADWAHNGWTNLP
jgi:hypothetical protein